MEWIPAKTIVSGYMESNEWFGNNYNMNIYKGCSHGCIYCDSRSDCYHVDNFDEVRAKENALSLIEKELKSKRRSGVIGTGAMSDPYNPIEKKVELTRGALALINRYGYGVSIATKSDLVVRDIDLLKKIAQHSPVLIKLTITAADDKLSKIIEPHVAPSSARFEALAKLAENGIYCGILMMPILPFIEDTPENISTIVRQGIQAGVKFIYPGFGVTLRSNQRDWYFDKLDQYFPGLKKRYIETFQNAYSCGSPRAQELWNLVKAECLQHNIDYKMKNIISAYKRGYEDPQISLFD